MQANHLGPFLLTRLLESPLACSSGRVVNVSSVTHRAARIPDAAAFFTDPNLGARSHSLLCKSSLLEHWRYSKRQAVPLPLMG